MVGICTRFGWWRDRRQRAVHPGRQPATSSRPPAGAVTCRPFVMRARAGRGEQVPLAASAKDPGTSESRSGDHGGPAGRALCDVATNLHPAVPRADGHADDTVAHVAADPVRPAAAGNLGLVRRSDRERQRHGHIYKLPWDIFRRETGVPSSEYRRAHRPRLREWADATLSFQIRTRLSFTCAPHRSELLWVGDHLARAWPADVVAADEAVCAIRWAHAIAHRSAFGEGGRLWAPSHADRLLGARRCSG